MKDPAKSLGKALPKSEQVAQSLLLALLFAVPALLCAYAASVSDPDIWWHLRSGEWIVQHHAVPRTDPFSSFGAGKPWAAYSWLFEVFVIKLFQRLGLTGIVVYTTGMVLATTIALHHLVKRLQADFSFVVLLTFLASVSLWRLDSPRPWHFTILFFVLELDILMQARRTGSRRELLWLPMIFALWANLHIQFVDGLLVLGIAFAEAVAARWWSAARTHLSLFSITTVFVASIAATLCNPYGWRIFLVAHDLAVQPGVMDHISELQAIPFRALSDYCILLLALGATAALARSRRFHLFETMLCAMAIFLAFRSQRDVWVVAAAAAAIIASTAKSDPIERRQAANFFRPLTVSVAALMLFAGFRVMHIDNPRLSAQLARDLPVRAVDFVNSKGLAGPLYNDYTWGGYLMWGLRQPVSIDGRAALQGDARLDRFSATWNAAPDWRSDVELEHSHLVIGPVKSPLSQVLRLDPRFQLVFEDKVAVVFTAAPLPSELAEEVSRRPSR